MRSLDDDLRSAFRLLSRLPVGTAGGDARRSTRGLRFAPLVGAAIACGQAAVMAGLLALHLPALAVAGVGIAVSLGLTGALHEDGLADVADGFGGGATRERKLAIMRDSRIGTYGAAALGCSLLVRAACLAGLAVRGPAVLAAGLLVAATLSRSLMLVPVALLRPARPDGLGASVTEGARGNLVWSLAIAAAVALAAAAWATLPLDRLAIALAAAAAASGGMTALAHRQIGGMTGDVAGATQQLAEIGVLLALSAG